MECGETQGIQAMPVKIKIIKLRSTKVEVKVRRPKWQQFIAY